MHGIVVGARCHHRKYALLKFILFTYLHSSQVVQRKRKPQRSSTNTRCGLWQPVLHLPMLRFAARSRPRLPLGTTACRCFSAKASDRQKQSPQAPAAPKITEADMIRSLGQHVWPSGPDTFGHKARVVSSLGLLLGSKLVTIQVRARLKTLFHSGGGRLVSLLWQVPFIFKDIVDSLNITVTSPEVAASALPLTMLIGCTWRAPA